MHVVQLLADPANVGVRCIDGPLDQSLLSYDSGLGLRASGSGSSARNRNLGIQPSRFIITSRNCQHYNHYKHHHDSYDCGYCCLHATWFCAGTAFQIFMLPLPKAQHHPFWKAPEISKPSEISNPSEPQTPTQKAEGLESCGLCDSGLAVRVWTSGKPSSCCWSSSSPSQDCLWRAFIWLSRRKTT